MKNERLFLEYREGPSDDTDGFCIYGIIPEYTPGMEIELKIKAGSEKEAKEIAQKMFLSISESRGVILK